MCSLYEGCPYQLARDVALETEPPGVAIRLSGIQERNLITLAVVESNVQGRDKFKEPISSPGSAGVTSLRTPTPKATMSLIRQFRYVDAAVRSVIGDDLAAARRNLMINSRSTTAPDRPEFLPAHVADRDFHRPAVARRTLPALRDQKARHGLRNGPRIRVPAVTRNPRGSRSTPRRASSPARRAAGRGGNQKYEFLILNLLTAFPIRSRVFGVNLAGSSASSAVPRSRSRAAHDIDCRLQVSIQLTGRRFGHAAGSGSTASPRQRAARRAPRASNHVRQRAATHDFDTDYVVARESNVASEARGRRRGREPRPHCDQRVTLLLPPTCAGAVFPDDDRRRLRVVEEQHTSREQPLPPCRESTPTRPAAKPTGGRARHSHASYKRLRGRQPAWQTARANVEHASRQETGRGPRR